jgi:acyl carrier protein
MEHDRQPGRQALAKIKEALMSHPEVSDAEVLLVPELSAGPVAAVVVKTRVTGLELRQHARGRLESDALPEIIALVPRLPRINGHADAAALADQIASGASPYRYAAPRSAIEGWLASQWEDATGQAEIGIYDDFFEIGGHSVSAIRILTELHVAHGVRLSIDDFFELATIDRLAAAIENAKKNSPARASSQVLQ